MTKKHFIKLADALRATKPKTYAKGKQWTSDLEAIADFCRSQNPQFNRERWLGYIAGTNGPSGGVV